MNQNLRHYTERHTTPRLQSVSPFKSPDDLEIHGVLTLTSREARHGCRKLISISEGLRKRNMIVTVPPDVKDGTPIRLKGLGQKHAEGNRGDLFLEIRTKD